LGSLHTRQVTLL